MMTMVNYRPRFSFVVLLAALIAFLCEPYESIAQSARIPDLTTDATPLSTDMFIVHKTGEARAKKTTRGVLRQSLSGVGSCSAGEFVSGLNSDATPTCAAASSISATYLTLSLDGNLSSERVFTVGSGLTSSDAGANGAYTISLSYAATLAGNPTMSAGECRMATTGIICEGSTADTIETLLAFTNSSSDKTITFPNETGTVCTTGAVCSGYSPALVVQEVDAAPTVSDVAFIQASQTQGLIVTEPQPGVARLSIADATTTEKGVAVVASGAANLVMATPNGSSGANSLRALVAGDLPASIPVSKGGTGVATLTVHGVVIGNGTSAVNVIGPGTAGQVLVSNGPSADPTFQNRASVTEVDGIEVVNPLIIEFDDLAFNITEPVAGIAHIAIATLNQNTTGTAAGLSTVNDVAHGGTGVSTLTAHGVVIGSGTSGVNITGAGTAGQVLTSNGPSADPTFQPAPTDGTYTPILVNVSNAPTMTAYICQWLKVNNTVTTSCKFDYTATSVAFTQVGVPLPVAANFTSVEQLAGTGTVASAAEFRPARVGADAVNDRAEVSFFAPVAGVSNSVTFTFTYHIP